MGLADVWPVCAADCNVAGFTFDSRLVFHFAYLQHFNDCRRACGAGLVVSRTFTSECYSIDGNRVG